MVSYGFTMCKATQNRFYECNNDPRKQVSYPFISAKEKLEKNTRRERKAKAHAKEMYE